MTNHQVTPATHPLGTIVILRAEESLGDNEVTLYAVTVNHTGDRCDIAPLGGGPSVESVDSADLCPIDPACIVLATDGQVTDEDATVIPAKAPRGPGSVVTLDGVKTLRIVVSIPTPGSRFVTTVRVGGGDLLTTGVPMFPVTVAFVSA
jgi:hypothetical protein